FLIYKQASTFSPLKSGAVTPYSGQPSPEFSASTSAAILTRTITSTLPTTYLSSPPIYRPQHTATFISAIARHRHHHSSTPHTSIIPTIETTSPATIVSTTTATHEGCLCLLVVSQPRKGVLGLFLPEKGVLGLLERNRVRLVYTDLGALV
nr:hypothetical protein [Tanacetum cinerariifolium]